MMNLFNNRIVDSNLKFAKYFFYIVTVFSTAVICGWVFDRDLLLSVLSPPMQPNAAAALFVLALACLQCLRKRTTWAIYGNCFLVATVFTYGVVTLLEYLLNKNLGVDLIIPNIINTAGFGPFPGRPSPQTALNLTLLSISLIVLQLKPSAFRIWQGAALLVIVNTVIDLTGFFFGAADTLALPSITLSIRSSVVTLGSFLLLSSGIILSRSKEGVMTLLTHSTRSSHVARRIFMAMILAPPFFGVVTKLAVLLGIFDSKTQASVLVVLVSLAIMVVMWRVLRQAETTELRLRNVLKQLRIAKLVADNLPAMIAYWDRSERCRFANKAYFDWFGFRPSNLIGREMIELLGKELYQKNLPYIRGALHGEMQFFERDLIYHATGETKITQALYVPNIIDKKIEGFFVLVTDITELKNAIQTREDVLAIVSHDIKNILSSISLVAQMLERQKASPDKVRSYAAAIRRAVLQMQNLIENILDLAKIRGGHYSVDLRIESVSDTILPAVEALRPLADSKQIQLDVKIPHLNDVICDKTKISQVISNLVTNAIKFTPPNGRIVVSAEQIDSKIQISVCDTGPGIPAENIPKVFDRFWQAKNNQKFGSGLGLAIAKGVMDSHKSKIWVSSEVGKGAKFTFELNLASKENPSNILLLPQKTRA